MPFYNNFQLISNQLRLLWQGHYPWIYPHNIPILWWPSVSGGTNGAKLRYVEKRFAEQYKGKDNEVFCILTDKEPVRTFVSRELTSRAGKKFHRIYKCRKPVKQYYIWLEVDKRGLAYTKKDNAFISVDDPVVLQEIANTITGSVSQ